MDSLEILLMLWSTILAIATFVLVLLASDLLLARSRLRHEAGKQRKQQAAKTGVFLQEENDRLHEQLAKCVDRVMELEARGGKTRV